MTRRSFAAISAAVLLLAGCGGEQDGGTARGARRSGPTPVTVEATEYGYSLPRHVKGGVAALEMTNVGEELHEFALVRLEGNRTERDLLEALMEGDPPPWMEDVAGVPVLSPGRSVTMTRDLDEPGTYVFLCFLPSPDGRPHAELGMIGSFEVSGDSGAVPPRPDATIAATDQGLDVPTLSSGLQTIELTNTGNDDHELWLVAFEPGKTDADVEAWFESGQRGPAPATFVGGIQSIPPGTSVFQELRLEQGVTYTVADYQNEQTATFTAS
jgi:hypothetical protein